MSSPVQNKLLTCEQCGAPLQSRAGESDCLQCLLSTGIQADESGVLAPEESGTRMYHHYEILTRPDGTRWELGRGAMGVAYKARDVNLKTLAALKIINARFSTRSDARRRFLREAQLAAQLRHPNVASVYHFGAINTLPELPEGSAETGEVAELGDCFYAMEYVEGENLEARVQRAGPLGPLRTLEIGRQVARALAAAERRGLVHRDLKPSNIVLSADAAPGRGSDAQVGEAWVKVIDFGLAQAVTEEGGPLHCAGPFFGTLAFSSPEQIAGHPVDIRSDIYSLGLTLWYALTGKVPFPNRSARQPRSEMEEEPLPVGQLIERKVPVPLRALLHEMLASQPTERPSSATELGQAIGRCLVSLRLTRQRRALQHRALKWTGALAIAVALIWAAVHFTAPASLPNDKSIAVLPFRNLSQDPANAFFAEGVQDDLFSRLVKIRDLRVISRQGTARYPANAPRNAQAIGRELGARNLLEGSLRRSGDRIYLHVALIDARDGHEIWSEGYERKLADAIGLQGQLAGAVAEALNARLSPQESVGVRATITVDPDAYVLYLRGRKSERSPTFAISDYEAAEKLYTQAIAVDPGFALAHARLASTIALLYRFRGPSEELRNRAYAEAREALRLQPGLGEAHLVSGLCSYRIDRDFEHALPELIKARKLLPNDTEAASYLGFIHRRRGEWREARAALEVCYTRDPGNASYAEELYTTAYLIRDWPAARQHAIRAEVLAPSLPLLKVQTALVDLWQKEDLRPLQNVFQNLPDYGDAEGTLAWMRWDAAMLRRDFAAAQAAIDGFPFDTLSSVYSAPVPKSYLEGCIALAQGDAATAQQNFALARPAYEAETLAHPDNPLRHARLGLLYAYLGRKAEALREGQRAVDLCPVSEDAFDGPEYLSNLALIHARVGDAEKAVTMIDSLLRQPGGVFFYEASMSLAELRLRWQWDSLRGNPRFQKVLAGPEPATEF